MFTQMESHCRYIQEHSWRIISTARLCGEWPIPIQPNLVVSTSEPHTRKKASPYLSTSFVSFRESINYKVKEDKKNSRCPEVVLLSKHPDFRWRGTCVDFRRPANKVNFSKVCSTNIQPDCLRLFLWYLLWSAMMPDENNMSFHKKNSGANVQNNIYKLWGDTQ